MHSRFRILICLAVGALFLAACSSNTVVARDERATNAGDDTIETSDDSTTSDIGAAADDEEPDDNSDPAADVEDDDADANAEDDGDNDRGGRETDDNSDGFGLGGAEQLQGLLDDCEGDNDLACDILFQISEFDSEEEAAALTCGGRSEAEVAFCTADIDAGDDGLVFDADSAGLDRVVEACEDEANMTACDFLFYRSPLDSEFQEIGGTCGGRVDVAIPDCRTFVGQ